MQFLYFIPNVGQATPAALRELGLDALLGTVAQGPVDKGPAAAGSVGGCLVASGEGTAQAPLRVLAEGQRWAPVFARPFGAGSAVASPSTPDHGSLTTDYYLGWRPDDPPTADELRRARIVPGRMLRLGDGAEWEIPVARLLGGAMGVEIAYVLDETGQRAARPVPRHQALWEAACGVTVALVGEDAPGLPRMEGLAAATLALAANYRVGEVECLALGLLDSQTAFDACCILSGVADALDEHAKKNSPHGSGPPD